MITVLALTCLAQAELTQLHLGQNEGDVLAVLELWNRWSLTPKTKEGGLDPAAFERIVVAERGPDRWVLTFARGGLTSALGRYRVPVDASADPPGGWSPRRLDPLRRALQALKPFGLVTGRPDAHGNITEWQARAAGGAVRVLYRPGDDELLVLLAEG